MNKKTFQYIYGPVYSWRLGMSLGVDPISCPQKICNFNCLYCQLGENCLFQSQRKNFIPVQAIVDEIKKISSTDIDYITFSGCGEPTLAKNLGAMIRGIKRVRKEKIAVITNASLIHQPDVQADLAESDLVLAKLDAFSQESFVRINRGVLVPSFDQIIKGMCTFRKKFKGKFALQIMFMDDNKGQARKIAEIAKKIDPDEVQINTPLRPSPIKPLTKKQMGVIKRAFIGFKVVSVYDVLAKPFYPFDEEKTVARHGKYKS
jgi:wyosine [tRNA(Phe)-imidazoG37] synthetase (radical SAM superfamily)